MGAVPSTVIIQTRDMRRLADFYGGGFEWGEPEAVGDDHLGFRTPTVYFGFDQVDRPDGKAPGPVSTWFDVPDLDAAFARFVKLGARVEYPPTRKPWGGYLAAVHDPDGNLVGLSQADGS